MAKKKLLLIIDPQYDFIEGGNLPVSGAENAMNGLANFIKVNGGKYEDAFITVDWHPQTHCSFKEFGGEWPVHCVQFSRGASIYQPILNALHEAKIDHTVLTKGTSEDREEYSVFRNAYSCGKLVDFVLKAGIKEIDICGIAGDICVLSTLKDALRNMTHIKFNVLFEFCPSIDGGKSLSEFIDKTERCEKV